MLQDLHSHTYYSFCGADQPEDVVEAAIAGGLELIGITDHNYGVCCQRLDVFFYQNQDLGEDHYRCFKRYYDHINLLREKYKDRITVLRGIEICTLDRFRYPINDNDDISFFDYCLIENIDAMEQSVAKGDLFAYAERCGCKAGVAHTDLFGFAKKIGMDPYEFFKKMAERGIFWEMNVSYDPTHNFRQHQYMLDFFDSPEQQDIVRRAGVEVSVGFDGHRVCDYLPERVTDYCRKIEEMKIKMPFEDLIK
ncbi:MAG: PHP domain-containing protein [Clostridia bacterium]|nr:PHP domain-containing protein [Clostridia bacterium]